MSSQGLSCVYIVGTVHLGRDQAPEYVEYLSGLLLDLHPDIICAELTPEQAAGRASIDSKPEYHAVVLPVAERIGARVTPIQPTGQMGNDLERRKEKAIEDIVADSASQLAWRMWGEFGARVEQTVTDMVADRADLAFLQSHQLDRCLFEPWWSSARDHFPDFYAEWADFNQMMFERLLSEVRANPEQRIVLTIGMAHRYWMRQRLKDAGITPVYPGQARAADS